jgi:hypothetical protein
VSRTQPGKRDLLHRVRDIERPGPQPLLDWQDATLLGKWVPYSVQTHATPGFHIDPNGYVHMRGLVTGGAEGDPIMQLPVGYRPEALTSLLALCFGPGAARIDVAASAEDDPTSGGTVTLVSVYAPAGLGYVSLDGLRFRAFS